MIGPVDLAAGGDFLATSLRLAVPLAFAALGGVISERAGVFNVALEACLLGGAFGAALGAMMLGSPFAGLAAALCCAVAIGAALSLLAVRLGVNQLVAGLALNILVLGLTSYCSRLFLGGGANRQVAGFTPAEIPVLSELPLLGPMLFRHDLLTYALVACIALSWWAIYRTPWGLALRAVGENARAVDAAGIDVTLLRSLAVMLGCAVAGLGGAFLVLSHVFIFTEHMSAGKGFVALAAVILGRWNPVGALAACLLFGACDALQLRLQFGRPDIPYQLFSMLPFLASLVALVFSGKVRPPAGIGVKYVRGGK